MGCTKCGAENREGAKFCNECAAPLVAGCPVCAALNKPGAKFCDACGSALSPSPPPATESQPAQAARFAQPESGATAPDGERKTVTALFADIKGSMELMEDLDPEEARAIVDPALKLMIDAVDRYGGYVVQSTGDGIFALFGAPVAHEDHAQRALYAALRIHEEMRRYSARLREAGNPPLEARAGVNTGQVVVRSLTTSQGHTEYTPIGHSTSLAARMQTLAPTGSIAATAQVRKLCEGYFMFKDLGPTRVKGVAERVNVYEVTGLGPLRTRLQVAAQRGLTRFVGREAELAQMRRALELAGQGHGQIVAAMGEPGAGKSRLFFEFKAVAQCGCLLLEAWSVSHGKASAYLPVIELLRGYFRVGLEDDPRRRREKVLGKVLGLERSLEDTLPCIFALLGIQDGDDPLARMDAHIRRRRTLEAVKRILLRESLNQPLMVIFEDLHWIDEETQSLLNLLADSIANARVLLAVNYRPEYRHEWGSRTHYTQLRLDPLVGESAEAMLDALLGDGVELAPIKRMVAQRSQGNPFFIEEIIQALFDEGVLMRDGAVKVARELSQVHLPPTVQGILAARIDRLPAAEKELLQTLAVLGREFPVGLIRSVTQTPEGELERMLRNLQLGEFIYEQPAFPDPEYSFKHALTQEVAYNSVLAERRRMLHGWIGAAIEKLHADHIEDHLAELAHHFARSADTAKAVEYLFRAGQSAAQQAASREAVDRFEAGLSLLESLPAGVARDQQELEIRSAMFMPLLEVRGPASPQSWTNIRRAQELCDQGSAPVALVSQVLNGLLSCYLFIADFEMARTLATRLIELGEQRQDESAETLGHLGLAAVNTWVGEHRAAATASEYSVAICQRLLPDCPAPLLRQVVSTLANARMLLSGALWQLGYPEQALRQNGLLQALPRNLCGSFEMGLIIMSDFQNRCQLIRDSRGARENAETFSTLAKENGFSFFEAYGALFLGHVALVEGAIEEGVKAVLQGSETLKASGEIVLAQEANANLAQAFLTAGRATEGLAVADEAIAAANQLQTHYYEAELHRLKGELLLIARASESEAEESMREAIAIAQRQEGKSWELRAATSLARLLRKQGRIAEARQLLTPVYN